MPMPRSFGSSQVTFLPLIQIWPSVMSSRPAMQLSSVDLPQPDGPEQHDELALGDVEVELVQDVDAAVGEVQVLDRDGRLDGRHLVHGVQPFTAPAAMPRTKSLPEMK